MALFFFVYGLSCLLCFCTDIAESERQIRGGTDVTRNISYMVSLRASKYSSTICGGTLIAPRIVLTAAHCLKKRSNLQWAVIGTRMSQMQRGSTGEIIKVRRVIQHPQFTRPSLVYDVMVVELEKASKYKPISIDRDSQFVREGQIATAYGWGQMENRKRSLYLRQVRLPLWDSDHCERIMHNAHRSQRQLIFDSMLCAGGRRGKDTSFGDSGGPLIVKKKGYDVLIGITSWSFKYNSLGNIPGVYVRIADPSILQFLDAHTRTATQYSPWVRSFWSLLLRFGNMLRKILRIDQLF